MSVWEFFTPWTPHHFIAKLFIYVLKVCRGHH